MNISHRIGQLRKRAQLKNIPFDLDVDWIKKKLEAGRCDVTSINFSDDVHSPFYPSVDRKDSSKGYTKDNCQLVIYIYNVAKADFNSDVVLIWSKEFIKRYETMLGNSR